MLAKIRSQPLSSTRSGTVHRVALLALGCVVALALLTSDAFAGQLPVGLGAADSFAALAGTTVTNTGFSTLNGDLGVSPGSALTGFPPGTVNGTVHATDPVANQAQSDLTAAYNDAAGRTPPIALPADVGGRTLAPGVYKSGAGLAVTGTVTLDGQGDPNAVFIFQVGSTLTTSVASSVNLIGGAQACNVSWQIGRSATLGTSSVFAGNILALTSISMKDGVTLNGRALARNGAVTLINDTITAAHCAPGTTGGPPLPGGMTGGPPLPGGITGGPPPPGGITGGPPPPGGITGGDTRAPAPPILISPRAHERVYAGNVSFRWRAAPRAERYTLMVDHHRMNTGPRTRATVRVRPGSHSFRVIAQNRYGARSSRHRAFRAVTAPNSSSAGTIRGLQGVQATVGGAAGSARNRYGTRSLRPRAVLAASRLLQPRCDTTRHRRFSERQPIGPVRYKMATKCDVITAALGVTLRESVSLYNTRPKHRGSSTYVRHQLVSGPSECVPLLPGSCESQFATYGPDLGTFTRRLVERIRTTDTLTPSPRVKRQWVPSPKDPQTKLCRGYYTRTLVCDFNVQFIAPDHRCDRTPALNRDPNPAQKDPKEPLARFRDGQGRVSRLTYGRTHREPAPQPKGVFWFGFGYKKIAAKHGFGPADVTATQIALKARPGRTLGKGNKRRVTYTTPVDPQNGTTCERVVVIDYPYVNNKFGTGTIITSYGSSEADLPDPVQQ